MRLLLGLLAGGVGGEVVDDAVQFQSGRGGGDEVAQERDEVVRAGRVGDPPGDVAVVDVEPGEQHGGAVAAVLELAPHGRTWDRRLGRVDTRLGLHPGLLVH